MMDIPGVAHVDHRTGKSGGRSSSVSWGHLGSMLTLIAGTISFWLLLFRHVRGENRKHSERP